MGYRLALKSRWEMVYWTRKTGERWEVGPKTGGKQKVGSKTGDYIYIPP